MLCLTEQQRGSKRIVEWGMAAVVISGSVGEEETNGRRVAALRVPINKATWLLVELPKALA